MVSFYKNIFFYVLHLIFSVIVFQPKLVQRGLFEQAPKVFGAEENLSCGSVGRQSNPELQLKHFQKMTKNGTLLGKKIFPVSGWVVKPTRFFRLNAD